MIINSRQRFPRKADTLKADLSDVPEEYQSLIGEYNFPMQNAGVTVSFKDDQLFIAFSPQNTMPMEKDEANDRFLVETPKSTIAISFQRDDSDNVTAMLFSELVPCPRIDNPDRE